MELIQKIKKIKPAQLIFPLIVFTIFVGTIIGIVKYQNEVKLNRVPVLEITTPANGAKVDVSQIIVEGKTSPKNKIILDGKVISVSTSGAFRSEVPLGYGENTISVVAENKAGKQNKKKLSVSRLGKSNEEVEKKTAIATPGKAIPQNNSSQPAINSNLSSSGPENFWIPEALSLSAVGSAWAMSRKKLKKEVRK